MIAQRCTSVSIVQLNSAATAICTVNAAHNSANDPERDPSSGSVTSARSSAPAIARYVTAVSQPRIASSPAFARSWNIETNPRIVAARVTQKVTSP